MTSCFGLVSVPSTNAVFPHGMTGCSEKFDITQLHSKLEDGYAQSKWVAEQLVTRAGQRGIPVVIYRLGKCNYERVTKNCVFQESIKI